jgi:hypothetical protein
MTDVLHPISVKGQIVSVPALTVDGRVIIAPDGRIRIARVHDEPFLLGEGITAPEKYVDRLREWPVRPDLFVFAQKFTAPEPRFSYRMEWDNFAVLTITTYEEWLKKQAKKDVRENLRRAAREGVEARVCEYTDDFVRGIKSLYDETPIRQGRPFWHHGKAFEKVKRENGTYLERSEYIGAFFEDELIGFIKMVYIGDVAKTMQVISKDKYFHKRPTNALIAKAVEVCATKGIRYFNYGQYAYPGKKDNSLTEFKARHGFERRNFPRYYVPLTLKGRLYLALGLHRGMKRLIPTPVLNFLLKKRADFHRRKGSSQA